MIEITVRDTASGEFETKTIEEDDYFLIYGFKREVTNVTKYANGTHVITVKKVTS